MKAQRARKEFSEAAERPKTDASKPGRGVWIIDFVGLYCG